MVIADTSVWIEFFNRPQSVEKRTLDLLIDGDEAVLIGVVLAELLQGCRTPKDRHEVTEAMLALPYIELTQTTWIRTGDLSSDLLRRGLTVPIPDLMIAAVALEHDCRVYSRDRHFQHIPRLSFYSSEQ
ncbi:MAG: type II toxin-antitoxin system VapC family toxin [Nitrospirota bacterium]